MQGADGEDAGATAVIDIDDSDEDEGTDDSDDSLSNESNNEEEEGHQKLWKNNGVRWVWTVLMHFLKKHITDNHTLSTDVVLCCHKQDRTAWKLQDQDQAPKKEGR